MLETLMNIYIDLWPQVPSRRWSMWNTCRPGCGIRGTTAWTMTWPPYWPWWRAHCFVRSLTCRSLYRNWNRLAYYYRNWNKLCNLHEALQRLKQVSLICKTHLQPLTQVSLFWKRHYRLMYYSRNWTRLESLLELKQVSVICNSC